MAKSNRLTDEQIKTVVSRASNGEKSIAIAKDFNIHPTTVDYHVQRARKNTGTAKGTKKKSPRMQTIALTTTEQKTDQNNIAIIVCHPSRLNEVFRGLSHANS